MADEIISRADARAKGLTRYFTGKPCKHGHIAKRFVGKGNCFQCLDERQKAKRANNPTPYGRVPAKTPCKFGHQSERTTSGFCVECRREWDRVWAKNNPDKVSAKSKKRFLANRDECLSYSREWRARNPGYDKAWNAANPEKYKKKARLGRWRRRARISNAEGHFIQDDIDRIFKAQRGRCAYCKISLKHGYHIDHIVAIARGGSNWPSNLQLCCSHCNHTKHASDPIDYARSVGFLL